MRWTNYFSYSEDALPDVQRAYQADGAVVVKNVVDPQLIASYRKNLMRLMQTRLNAAAVPSDRCGDLDGYYRELCAVDENLSGEVILAARDLVEFYQLVSAPRVRNVAEKLVGSEVCQIVHDVCLFRIDPPVVDHPRLFDWHQDYPYNVLSRSAVTLWLPLTDITPEMGPLRVVPRSHGAIRPVSFRQAFAGGGKGMGHKVFELKEMDRALLEASSVEIPDVNAGDGVFFHSCLLHRSGTNRSDRARWVFNVRYGDMLDDAVVQRGWRVVRDRNPYCFREVHPDLTEVIS